MKTLTLPKHPACAEPPLFATTYRLKPAKRLILAGLLASLSGCCSLIHIPPSAEDLARLPVVEFPDTPPAGDFILKLPKGKPIPVQVSVKGSLLSESVEDTLHATIKRDLFVHKEWASWDGKNWEIATDLVGVDLRLALPSYEHPKPGEIALQVDQKSRR